MARNRKTQSAAVRFGPAVKALLLCLLIGGSGLGYVWQKEQIARLARQIKKSEQKLATLADQNDQLRRQLANLRTPEVLGLKIKQANLGLALPQESQILRLSEPVPERPATSRLQYAARSERPGFGP